MKRLLSAIAIAAAMLLPGVSSAGQPCTTCTDLAPTVQTGTFTSTTTSAAVMLYGPINVSFWGTFVASTTIQRSFDGGTTWINVSEDTAGTAATYTTAVSLVLAENEPGVLYRLSCVYTSGTVNFRFSGGPRLT